MGQDYCLHQSVFPGTTGPQRRLPLLAVNLKLAVHMRATIAN